VPHPDRQVEALAKLWVWEIPAGEEVEQDFYGA